ncbi:O-antigen ligase family protein [Jatrophihabitans sp.]|uniref:O-antigen ligase family protein n=1 Tax=Jatrophihabitans sp. TaxID=1932789 RepID=UPI0030C6DBE8
MPRPQIHRGGSSAAANVGRLTGLAAGVTGARSIGLPPWELLLAAAFIVAIGSVLNIRGTRGQQASLRIAAFDLFCIAYFAWSVFADIFDSRALEYTVGKTTLIAPVWSFLAYVAARMVVRTEADLVSYLKGFVAPAILNALLAVGQTVSPSFAHVVLTIAPSDGLDTRLTGEKLIRATGLIGHWTGLGFYFCAILAAVGCVAVMSNGLARLPVSFLVCGIACTVGVIVTLTFSVILAALVIIAVVWFSLGIRPAQLLAVVGGGFLVFLAFGSVLTARITEQTAARPTNALPSWVPNTLNYRWRIWTEQTVPAIEQRKLTGWGTRVYTDLSPKRLMPDNLVWKSPESQWLFAAISYGIIAAILLAGVIIVAGVVSWRGWRRGGRPLAVVLALVVGTVIGSITDPNITNHGLPVPLFAVIGATFAVFVPSVYGYSDREKRRFGRGRVPISAAAL